MYFGVLLIIVSVVFFPSCSREADWNSQEIVNIDSTLIDQIVVLDTTPIQIDTLLKCKFSYDEYKRLHTYEENSYLSNNFLYYKTTFRNFYSNSDTLPQIVFIKNVQYNNNIPNSISYDTLFLSYQDGFVVRDSSSRIESGELGYNVYTFSRQSDWVFKVKYKIYAPGFGITEDSLAVFANWQNGNLIQEIDSLNGAPINDFRFSYDNKPNPFHKAFLKIPTPGVRFWPLGDPFIFGPLYSKFYATSSRNNLVSQRDIYNNSIAPTSYNLIYGTNGLPQSAFRYISSAPLSVQKYIYQYTQ